MSLSQAPVQVPKTNKVFTLPIYWQQSKKKKVLVGMNVYRNWHYYTSAAFKREFSEIVLEELGDFEPILGEYSLEIKVFYKNSSCDASNIVALIEKVFLDTLVIAGALKGDSVKHHKSTFWTVVEKDAENPRCEITVKEYKLC